MVVEVAQEEEPRPIPECKCGRPFEHICVEMAVTGRPARAWYVNPQAEQEVEISAAILDNSRWIISTGVAELRVVVGFRPREGTPGGSHNKPA